MENQNKNLVPKAIAMYLPQFHNVEENNLWWGEGFTDWTAMECAQPLFENHQQPKCPLNNNKYDLLKKNVFQWQATLMHKYEVYGMAFYHYWFKDGKKILEKPAENLLQWTDIDMPFCFYWANESWVRSWSKLNNQNVWASNFETQNMRENENGILLEQEYGDKQDWIEHFEYLSQFFEDSRYIKIENKPVFMFYKPTEIPCLEDMITLWNDMAIERGFSGIYTIGAYCDNYSRNVLDAELVHEPMATIKRKFNERFINTKRPEVARFLPYDEVWRGLLDNNEGAGTTYWGGFSGYDDTPRRGNAGTVIFNGNPEKFKLYLTELYAKNAVGGNEFVFVNAWNEWGEGMYLEPDEDDKYGYLEAFPYARKHYKEEMYKYENVASPDSEKEELLKLQAEKRRYIEEKNILDKWLYLERNGKSILDYFKIRNIRHIAIYGYGVIGKHILAELGDQEEIICDYLIDKNARGINIKEDVYSPDEDMPPTEMIVVSTIHIFDEVAQILEDKINCKIISIKDIINEY